MNGTLIEGEQPSARRWRLRQFWLDVHHVMCAVWAVCLPLLGAVSIDKTSLWSWAAVFLAGPVMLVVQIFVFSRLFPRTFPDEEFFGEFDPDQQPES